MKADCQLLEAAFEAATNVGDEVAARKYLRTAKDMGCPWADSGSFPGSMTHGKSSGDWHFVLDPLWDPMPHHLVRDPVAAERVKDPGEP